MNKEHLKGLYQSMKDTIPKKTSYDRFTGKRITTYKINLFQFLGSSENCKRVADVGMTHYVSKFIEELKQLIKSKQNHS